MTEAQAINKVISLAESQVGYHEKASASGLNSKTANAGSANYTKYGKTMHSVQPSTMDYPAAWCDAFVDWLFYSCFGKELGKKMLCGSYDDYTINSAQLFKDAGRWTNVPKKGYQIFFQSGGMINHTGIVKKVSGGVVYTIEGNSSDKVTERSYSIGESRIAGYGMPIYSLVSDAAAVPASRAGTCTVQLGEFVRGNCDPEIRTIQVLLNTKGFFGKDGKPLNIDGELGENTAYAIEKLQKKAGMKNINFGTVSSKTWLLLID